MAYYHVRISVQGDRHDEVKTDVDEETMDRLVLGPYRSGRPITISGRTIPMEAVERIRISTSEEPAAQIIERLKAEDRQSSVTKLGGPSYRWRAAARARDVTDQFITGPPGSMVDEPPQATELTPAAEGGIGFAHPEPQRADRSAVFVVGGRDSAAVGAINMILRTLGVRVVEWEHAVAKTGLPNPYVGDVVETGLRMAAVAVVILTPDDLVRLRADLVSDSDGPEERELRGQARPNVYYEAGIADALGRERTVIVEIGNVKSLSDTAGRHVVRFDGSAAKRNALAERLRVAGLAVDTTGEDWLTVGEVAPVLDAAIAALERATSDVPPPSVDKKVLVEQVDSILAGFEQLRSRSQYDDLSDLPDESLQFVFRAQALIDRLAVNSPYAREAAKVQDSPPHIRIPYLVAALRGLREEGLD